MTTNSEKPILGILLGDATGIGPELVAKLAAADFYQDYCRPIIIGDARIFQAGLDTFHGSAPYYIIDKVEDADWSRGYPILDMKNQDPAKVTMGKASAYCGAACVEMIKLACQLCRDGKIEGFAFAPFHKAALKEGGCHFESEHYLMADLFGVTTPFGEINMLGDVMTVRTTSHVPIKDVSDMLTVERISRAIELGYRTAKSTGVENPKLGVAALNPHCGENGLCGTEEIERIGPAIAQAQAKGWDVEGPFSGDILFIRAFKGEFDAVVTMYHDQGQIALKLKGFDQGITVAGGQPYPVVTCAHGTAYGKAGKGLASTSAFENAVKMASKMAQARHNQRA